MSSNHTAGDTPSKTPKTDQAKKLATAFADTVQLIVESHGEIELQLARQKRLTEEHGKQAHDAVIKTRQLASDIEAYRNLVEEKDRQLALLQAELEKARYEKGELRRERDVLLQRDRDYLATGGQFQEIVTRLELVRLILKFKAARREALYPCKCDYGHDGRMPLRGPVCARCQTKADLEADITEIERRLA